MNISYRQSFVSVCAQLQTCVQGVTEDTPLWDEDDDALDEAASKPAGKAKSAKPAATTATGAIVPKVRKAVASAAKSSAAAAKVSPQCSPLCSSALLMLAPELTAWSRSPSATDAACSQACCQDSHPRNCAQCQEGCGERCQEQRCYCEGECHIDQGCSLGGTLVCIQIAVCF